MSLSENLSSTVILVGDPFRVDKITKHFDKIEFKTQNREFKSVTGNYKSKRITNFNNSTNQMK